MKLLLLTVLVGAGLSGVVGWTSTAPRSPQDLQDPQDSQDPQGEARSEQRPERDPIEGVYRLKRRMLRGAPDPNTSRGYVAITRRHLLLCFAGAGSDPDYPLLRAGVQEWKRRETGYQTTVQLGFYSDADGELHVEKKGELRNRRIDVVRGLLRIWQDESSFLEFERVE